MFYAMLIAANAAAWIWAWLAFGDYPTLSGAASLDYVFGLRHAFGAAHNGAVDNAVLKLVQDGKAPWSVGFFFSLGHSSIVVLASIVVAATAAAMQGRLDAWHNLGSVVGTLLSAAFLLAIGLANLLVLKSIWSAFARARRGEPVADEDLDALLSGRRLLARLLRPVFGLVSRSWHMYPVGFIFGLGFDTATEIGLLGIAASQAAQGLSFWSVLIFPALFTAGMSLMDTTDSVLMTRAYVWAFVNPVRKLWYNLTITAACVVVALFIGGVEALGLIAGKLGLEGRFWGLITGLNDNLANFGFAVVGIFIASWIISAVIYRANGFDNPQ